MTDDERPAPDSLRGKLAGLGRPDDEAEPADHGAHGADDDRADDWTPPEPKRPTDPPF